MKYEREQAFPSILPDPGVAVGMYVDLPDPFGNSNALLGRCWLQPKVFSSLQVYPDGDIVSLDAICPAIIQPFIMDAPAQCRDLRGSEVLIEQGLQVTPQTS